ncbi:Uncharacterised protein [Mycobacteroides abscessus subsp. bolletii]|nr:Uncharacterised protein [Mycobacteroides abscessus subsp. bolletii]
MVPGLALLGEGLRLHLGLPCLQRGPLRQVVCLRCGGLAAYFPLKFDREFGEPIVDHLGALRPELHQFRGDTGDLADGSLAGLGGPFHELHTQEFDEVRLKQ